MTDMRTPVRDTRTEILDVASELFTEKGYDATSLREIAERLGITKAALYYHFRSKDDILRALLEPMNTVVTELLGRLEAAPDVAGWVDALDWVIGMVFQNVAFFRLIERNRHAMEELRETLLGDHVELHQQIRKFDVACRLVDDNAHCPFRRMCTNIDQSAGKSLVPHARHRDQHLAVEISTPRRPCGGTCPYTLPCCLHE